MGEITNAVLVNNGLRILRFMLKHCETGYTPDQLTNEMGSEGTTMQRANVQMALKDLIFKGYVRTFEGYYTITPKGSLYIQG